MCVYVCVRVCVMRVRVFCVCVFFLVTFKLLQIIDYDTINFISWGTPHLISLIGLNEKIILHFK